MPRVPAQEQEQRGAGLRRAEERPPARPRGHTEPAQNHPEHSREHRLRATLKVTALTLFIEVLQLCSKCVRKPLGDFKQGMKVIYMG